jgi:cell division protein FtsB
MKTINEMKTTYAVLFTVIIVLLLGLIGRVGKHDEAIKEIQNTPITVATVDLTTKTVMAIANLEQEVDMLRLRVEDLMSITNIDKSVDLLSWKVSELEANTPARQYRLVDGKVIVEDYIPLIDDVERLQRDFARLDQRVKGLEENAQ